MPLLVGLALKLESSTRPGHSFEREFSEFFFLFFGAGQLSPKHLQEQSIIITSPFFGLSSTLNLVLPISQVLSLKSVG